MIRVLLDTNIMLDSFLQRAPFSGDADNILRANDRRLITGYVTASSILDIFYFSSLIRRQDMGYNRKDAYREAIEDVRSCLETLQICTVSYATLRQALALQGSDFEDDVQLACALSNKLDVVVTRDKKFQHSDIVVLTPAELLKRLAKRGKRR